MVPRRVATRPQCTAGAPSEVDTQWATLDDVCLRENAKQRFAILQGCPVHLKARHWHALTTALEAVHAAVQQHDVAKEIHGWKLLRRPFSRGRVRKAELSQRFDLFFGCQWDELHQEAMRDGRPSRSHWVAGPTPEKKARAVCQKVRLGEVSRARQCLTGSSVVPGTEDTFRELQNKRPQMQGRDLPREAIEHVPERLVVLDRKTFFDSLRCRPGRLHVRAFEIDAGCDRHTGTVVGNVQFARTRQSARRHWDCFDGSQADIFVETQRRCEGDCHWLHCASLRRQNFGETVHEGVRSGVCTIPICVVHQSGHRLCWVSAPINHRREPKRDNSDR